MFRRAVEECAAAGLVSEPLDGILGRLVEPGSVYDCGMGRCGLETGNKEIRYHSCITLRF